MAKTHNIYHLPIEADCVQTVVIDSPAHTGLYEGAIDLAVPFGTSVVAPLAGKVVEARDDFNESGPSSEFAHSANYIQIQHSQGEVSNLMHLGEASVLVDEGDIVETGQLVATTGSSGWMTDPHLHWDVYVEREAEPGFETLGITLAETASKVVREKELLVIPTEREGVALRRFTFLSDDIALFEAVEEDRDHTEMYGTYVARRYKTLADVTKYRVESKDKLQMGIWDRARFVGYIDARPQPNGMDAEIGYWLRASATGQGYATLALRALVEYIEPGFDKIYAEVNMEHTKSAAVVERAGFKPAGEVSRPWGRMTVFEASKCLQ